jgi:hypothetical protein
MGTGAVGRRSAGARFDLGIRDDAGAGRTFKRRFETR